MRILAILCGFLAAVAATAVLGAPTEKRTLAVGERTRTYLVHVPAGARAPTPVVLSFHGSATDARRQEEISGFSALADGEGFVAVYPQAFGKSWHVSRPAPEEVAFVRALLDDLDRQHRIDRSRVFATGNSNGAQMAWRIACDAPELVAAVGLVAGRYPRVCGTSRPPAIIFHGTADRLFPYRGRTGMMAIPAFAAAWGAPAKCSDGRVDGEVIYRKGDATGRRWACGRFQAVLYTLRGKGHTWPGSPVPDPAASRDVDASLAMWRFFQEAGGE